MLTCLSWVPRINASANKSGATLTQTVIFKVEQNSKMRVLQQPSSKTQVSYPMKAQWDATPDLYATSAA
jgi:hypothetical protein